MTTSTSKAGRFYEIRKQLGDRPYVLTEDISIPPMGIDARNAWREATYKALAQNVIDAQSISDGRVPDYVDFNAVIEKALLGNQYDACKELFADDARAWDIFLTEVRDFNKVDGTPVEDGQGNGAATPASSP